MSGDETPTRRGAGRPRKQAEPAQEKSSAKFPSDERIGQRVGEPTTDQIGFSDGCTYLVEDGVIVERIN